MDPVLLCSQANCTFTKAFTIQVTDSCLTCSPNEFQIPVDLYASSLIPAAQQPVFIQYRQVGVLGGLETPR